jgi:guanylate kinase
MNIPDNIISRKLKNVYFIIGGSCSGKTTSAKYLNEKYGMYHYGTDFMRKTYYESASIDYQPTLCRKINDFYDLNIDEVIEYETNVINEVTPMIIADLIELSGKYEKIICEGVYAILIAPLISYSKIIHLSTSNEIIKNDFFIRPLQLQILENIKNRIDISDSEKEKRINHRIDMACGVISKIDEISKLNIKQYYRNEKSTINEMLNIIENHFELI